MIKARRVPLQPLSCVLRAISLVMLVSFALLQPSNATGQPNYSNEIEAQVARARAALNVDPETSIAILEKSATLAQQRLGGGERDNILSDIDAVKTRALVRMNRIDEATSTIRRGFARSRVVQLRPVILAELTLSLGRVHQRRGEVQSALRDFQMAYKLFRSIGDKRSQAVALQSIAKLYVDGGDGATGLKYYKQSDEEYSGDPLMSLSSRNNRGSAYLYLWKPREAEAEFREALRIATTLDSTKYLVRVYANLAQSQAMQGQYAAASENVDNAFRVSKESSSFEEESRLWDLRSQIAFARRDYVTARAAVERALDGVDPATSEASFRQVHYNAARIFAAVGKTKLAYSHLEAVQRIDEVTAKLTATNAAALMAARFDFANQNTRIAQLKAREFQLQRDFLVAVVVGGALALILLTIGLIAITRSRNRERAGRLLLARTNDDLEKAIAAKMEFLATTSHEIRTPLNGILGMTQVMLADRQLGAALRDRISIVHDAGEAMRSLVDDILDVAKMDTGNLAVGTGTVALKVAIAQVADLWQLQADAKGVALVVDVTTCPEVMAGDEARIRQIVSNLMSNAMKFTDKGRITLSATMLTDGEDRHVEIAVRDSGIGIDPVWHQSIFELFQQVDGGTTRRYGGTGLGLAICRNLARAMGGDIRVESEAGAGSTFTISLPFVEAVDVSAVPSDRRSTAVVVERNPLTRGMMRAILSERFDVVLFADDETEACSAADRAGADWIIANVAAVDDFAILLAASIETLVLIGDAPAEVRGANVVTVPKPLSKSMLLGAIGPAPEPLAVAA